MRKTVIGVTLFIVAIGASLLAGCGARQGDWRYDSETELWYQTMGSAASPVDVLQASRAYHKYADQLDSLPGRSGDGVGKLPNGNYFIEVMFATPEHRDRAMREGLVPAELDGVPVLINNVTGRGVLTGA